MSGTCVKSRKVAAEGFTFASEKKSGSPLSRCAVFILVFVVATL